jgi:hypothetical protein
MTWIGWRWDGEYWHREPTANSESLSVCAHALSKIEDHYNIPSHWTAMTGGAVPNWMPAPKRRRPRRAPDSSAAPLEEP